MHKHNKYVQIHTYKYTQTHTHSYTHTDIHRHRHTHSQTHKPTHTQTHCQVLSHISSWLFETYSDRRNHCRAPSQPWLPLLADSPMPYLSPPVAMGYTLQSAQVRSTNFSKVSIGISSIMINKTDQLYFIHYYRVTIKINLLNALSLSKNIINIHIIDPYRTYRIVGLFP